MTILAKHHFNITITTIITTTTTATIIIIHSYWKVTFKCNANFKTSKLLSWQIIQAWQKRDIFSLSVMFESLCKGHHNMIVILHVVTSLFTQYDVLRSRIHKAVTGDFGVHHNIQSCTGLFCISNSCGLNLRKRFTASKGDFDSLQLITLIAIILFRDTK